MKTRMYHKDNTIPEKGWIFVFGSNLGGRHGKGAAVVARKNFGAEFGRGHGRTGDTYAIPIKTRQLDTLNINTVTEMIEEFVAYSRTHPELKFFVVRVGCGLGNYKDEQIAPLFRECGENCSFAEEWRPYLS